LNAIYLELEILSSPQQALLKAKEKEKTHGPQTIPCNSMRHIYRSY